MSTLRKQTRCGYTSISNDLLCDDALSYRARGIAAVLLSKPNNWEIRIEYLAAHGTEGTGAVRTALQELATLGYMMRVRERAKDGTVATVTIIADYRAFADKGTAQDRIYGYIVEEDAPTDLPEDAAAEPPTPQETDLPETDMTVSDMTEIQSSVDRQVIINTDLPTTEDQLLKEDATGADAPEPSPPSKPPRKKAEPKAKEPPLSDHPLIAAYITLHNRKPQTAQMKIIIAKNPPLNDWIRAMHAWAEWGYSPINIGGMLEWALNPKKIRVHQGAQSNNGTVAFGLQRNGLHYATTTNAPTPADEEQPAYDSEFGRAIRDSQRRAAEEFAAKQAARRGVSMPHL